MALLSSDELPRPSWDEFLRAFQKRWAQGEHVFINGGTGSGKTELMLRLMQLRTYGVMIVSKPRDPIFHSPYVEGFTRANEFKPRSFDKKILLSAKRGDSTRGMIGNQHEVFASALDRIYHDGGWTVGMDETLWLSNRLKLSAEVGDIAYLGRALGITGLYATQRPAHLPVIIPQNAEHAFVSMSGRQEDIKRLAELGGDPRANVAAIMSLRDKHDFLYIDTQGKMPLQVVNTHR
jgi:hypothetical protein